MAKGKSCTFVQLFTNSLLLMKVYELAFTKKGVAGLRLPCTGGKVFVPLSEIVRLEGRRNYTLIVINAHPPMLVAKTLGLFETELSNSFVRIRRGCIVNLHHASVGNDGFVRQKDGFTAPVARRRAKQPALLIQAAWEAIYRPQIALKSQNWQAVK